MHHRGIQASDAGRGTPGSKRPGKSRRHPPSAEEPLPSAPQAVRSDGQLRGVSSGGLEGGLVEQLVRRPLRRSGCKVVNAEVGRGGPEKVIYGSHISKKNLGSGRWHEFSRCGEWEQKSKTAPRFLTWNDLVNDNAIDWNKKYRRGNTAKEKMINSGDTSTSDWIDQPYPGFPRYCF